MTRLPLVAGAFAALAMAVTGCESIDPTEQAFSISLLNDLGRPVALKLCADDGCHSFNYTDTVKPNESYPENISDRELLTRWLVADQQGRVLGCLPLRFNGKFDGVVVRLSQKVPCPGRQPLRVERGRKVGDRV
jgi:hypothetical protein